MFLSDREGAENIWIANADGGDARALTKEKRTNPFLSPEWTPDGRYIVVSKSGGTPPGMRLWLYHVDGGTGVQLTGNSEEQRGLYAVGPAFGSDPRYVYFTERTQAGSVYNQMRFRWQLGVHDRWTGESFRKSDEWGSGMRPVLSPDGRWLVYATRWDAQTGLRLRDLASGDDRWLLYPVTRDDQESAATRDLMPGSSFTPDSKALVTSFDGKLWRVEVPSGALGAIPFQAKVALKLGPKLEFEHALPQGPVRAQQIRHPRLSPDGRRLAFTALDRLYLMDYPGGTPRRASALEAAEHQPAWSPDGRHVAFVTWSDTDGGHLYRVPADLSSPAQRLSATASFYSDPVYTPDGARIVAVRGPRSERQEDFSPSGRGGQPLELVALPAEGGAVATIAPYRGPGRAHFGKDPGRLFVWEVQTRPSPTGPGSATGTLVSFRLDGSDRRGHLRVTGYKNPAAEQASPASEVLIGPDGEHAIVEAERRVYRISVPLVGGETPPTINVAGGGEGAGVPVQRLTAVGGEFLDWTEGGKAVTYALGRSFFLYDLAAAEAAEAKARSEAKAAEADKPAADKPESERRGERKKPAYEAVETEVVVEVPRPRPQGALLLSGARLVTMKGRSWSRATS